MTKLNHLTIADIRDGLSKGDFTSVEVTEACIDAMETHADLNAFIVQTPDYAMEQAKASDKRRATGEVLGSMDGVPMGMKDLFCTEGVQTTAASKMLEGFIPQYESTVSGKLKNGGAVMLGKTNLDEFAMGSGNLTSHFGSVTNPWKATGDDAPRVPGGSSGGSAAAVAARICPAATGTDTGGSIRQPAAFTGIVGLKPTYGRCSRWGIVAFASSLDQAGPMTRTVRDAAIMLQDMAGFDEKDSTSANKAVPNFEAALTGDVKGLRVGVPKEYRIEGIDPEIDAMWQSGIAMLKDAGAEIVDVSLPHTDKALPVYYIIAPAEASSNLARYDGVRYGYRAELPKGASLDDMYAKTRGEGFGKEVRRRIMMGTYVLSAGYYDAYYKKAQQVRNLIAQDFKNAFQNVDVLLTPTAPSDAFTVSGGGALDPVTMYLNDVFVVTASLAGLPGISVPTGLSKKGLPLGLQLVGRPWDEETVLRTAGVLETAANFTAVPSMLGGE